MTLILNKHISAIELLKKDQIEINTIEKLDGLKRILIVNLMPKKMETEHQILKILGKSCIDLKVDFLYTKTYRSKNSSKEYLESAYKTLDQLKDIDYDGMIITGAPLEFVDFKDIVYWDELKAIMDYSNQYIKSTIYLCWAVLAGLYHNYEIPKRIVNEKIVGVFRHRIINQKSLLLENCNEKLLVPHSRYFNLKEEDLKSINKLEVLCESDESGIYILLGEEGKQIYITGHSEYNTDTLKQEYERDLIKGLVAFPKNYFSENDPSTTPINTWSKDFQILINNWIKYYL